MFYLIIKSEHLQQNGFFLQFLIQLPNYRHKHTHIKCNNLYLDHKPLNKLTFFCLLQYLLQIIQSLLQMYMRSRKLFNKANSTFSVVAVVVK